MKPTNIINSMTLHTAYLVLGSNQGNRYGYIRKALEGIAQLPHTAVSSQSHLYETAAWGREDLPPHINVAVAVRTPLAPLSLLRSLQQIETALDRTRQTRWGERTIDIDIIYFDGLVMNHPDLRLPHPLMQVRNFVLVPLNEIAPDLQHPVLRRSTRELLATCPDTLGVTLLSEVL